jgi:glycosyltransferase involved in cell wall biosynthesis
MNISLVLLTLNEIEGLKKLFNKIPMDSVEEVFAIDGGSTDGTLEFMKANNITVYPQSIKGRGEAFREAFRRAKGDALILFSPDGNEDPNDIPKFRPLLLAGNDIVIATRMVKGAWNEEDDQFFKIRKWVNNIFTFLANIIWNHGPWVSDTINGYRAITKKAWNILALDGPGYTIEYQGSIRAFKQGLRIVEFVTHESRRFDGAEGSPSIPTGIAFIKIFFYELKIGKTWKPLMELKPIKKDI